MTIPVEIREKVEKQIFDYCDRKIPVKIRDKLSLDYKINGNSIILFEKRPNIFRKKEIHEGPIAKLKYIVSTKEWQLYYPDRNLRWKKYWNYEPKKRFSTLIKEIDKDPTCIFWG